MSQEQAPHKEQNTFRCAYATSRGTVLSKRPSQVRKINGMVQDQYFSLAVSSLGLIQVTAFRKQLFFPICILMPLAPEIPVTKSAQNIVIKGKKKTETPFKLQSRITDHTHAQEQDPSRRKEHAPPAPYQAAPQRKTSSFLRLPVHTPCQLANTGLQSTKAHYLQPHHTPPASPGWLQCTQCQVLKGHLPAPRLQPTHLTVWESPDADHACSAPGR